MAVTATLRYRKLNTQYAKWALKDEYKSLPIIDIAWDFLSIPVRDEKEVGTVGMSEIVWDIFSFFASN